jgi:hypothetical protein
MTGERRKAQKGKAKGKGTKREGRGSGHHEDPERRRQEQEQRNEGRREAEHKEATERTTRSDATTKATLYHQHTIATTTEKGKQAQQGERQ